MKRLQLFSIVTFLCCCLPLSVANAQSASSAQISGTVVDPQGAVVPGAKVTATNQGTGIGRSVTTTSTGNYVIPNLTPGTYDVKAESKGFSQGLSKDLKLNVGDQNGEFVLDFLREERIPVVARDLYDVWPRKVYFFPRTGKVLVKKLRSLSNDTVGQREHSYLERINQVTASGDFELFSEALAPI